MGVSQRTVQWLRQQSDDAVHLREQGLQRAWDPDILAKARAEGRILLTMDLDFGDLLAASGDQLPSVVIFRLHDERSERVNERLQVIRTRHEEDLQAGAVLSVSERAIRVRRLPIRRGGPDNSP